jgi:hypothetical protein
MDLNGIITTVPSAHDVATAFRHVERHDGYFKFIKTISSRYPETFEVLDMSDCSVQVRRERDLDLDRRFLRYSHNSTVQISQDAAERPMAFTLLALQNEIGSDLLEALHSHVTFTRDGLSIFEKYIPLAVKIGTLKKSDSYRRRPTLWALFRSHETVKRSEPMDFIYRKVSLHDPHRWHWEAYSSDQDESRYELDTHEVSYEPAFIATAEGRSSHHHRYHEIRAIVRYQLLRAERFIGEGTSSSEFRIPANGTFVFYLSKACRKACERRRMALPPRSRDLNGVQIIGWQPTVASYVAEEEGIRPFVLGRAVGS